MKKIYIPKKETKTVPWLYIAVGSLTFLFGCIVTSSLMLNKLVHSVDSKHTLHPAPLTANGQTVERQAQQVGQQQEQDSFSVQSVIRDLRILVVIAAFDFSQLPHLEEVLDSYHDVAVAGAQQVDVHIHATVPYPIPLIDLWNTRFNAENFQITIVLKSKGLRLHLVDQHRITFYEKIDEYDLFIYTEDDMRVSPTTVATYMYETKKIEQLVKDSTEFKPSDFNVGIVRYEYNYPSNVIIDDNTRQATQNVSRVYWEHSSVKRPVVPNAVETVTQTPLADKQYITMKNHHQGMFLATRDLLKDWAVRGPNCRFNEIRNRPGRGSQPTQGTQRVWMSSNMLYGNRHCNVQQVIPIDSFGALTILHLPNKNYRRVGKYRNRTFATGDEVFEKPHESLMTAMELHLAVRRAFPTKPRKTYRGIKVVDEIFEASARSDFLERRLNEFQAYMQRGGIMSEEDMQNTNLVE